MAEDLLDEVRAAAKALVEAKARRLAAADAAFAAGIPREDIAAALDMTRDGLYRLLRTS